jgi:hypothetical protein
MLVSPALFLLGVFKLAEYRRIDRERGKIPRIRVAMAFIMEFALATLKIALLRAAPLSGSRW